MSDIFDSIRGIAKKYEIEELSNKLIRYEQSVIKLREAVEHLNDDNDFVKESVIKRFECTYELSWKLLKRYLEEEGSMERILLPKSIFNKCGEYGIIKDDRIWNDIIYDMLLTNNIYDRDIVNELISKIQGKYLFAFEEILSTIKGLLENKAIL